jgi:putative ATP-binding cassette transporter
VFADDDLVAACRSVDLERLSSQLDRHANWDNELTGDEAQRLAFARLLLHKPRWICVDQALDALSEEERKAIVLIFDNELADAAVVSFSDIDLCGGFSTRTLHFIPAPETKDDPSEAPTGGL